MRFLFPEERIVKGLWSDYDFPKALTQDSPHSFALELIERYLNGRVEVDRERESCKVVEVE